MDEIRCELRFNEDDSRQTPGRLTGTLLTYEERAQDREEMFASGALVWPAEGIIIDEQHNRAAPILRTLPFLEGRALKISAPLPNTSRGRDAAENVKLGVLKGLSIQFQAITETRRAGVRVITSARLRRAGLVDDPSYAGSTVEVRSRTYDPVEEELLRWL